MSDVTVFAEGICKVYKMYWGPRSLLKELILGIPAHHTFWALRNVSFEIQQGEAFGIVGENGAGKTTLLKILTGTTYPTRGEASVKGRVSALLELGAGFHPEFSGRENIYFNGALMGFSPQEIQERVEEIIAFSELEEFIDKPVKTYSSGMYVRLGFAVATGFDPSVLIIDEALAVGDQRFQKKCTDRILAFRRAGKTILFCSHNLYQVRTLCNRALWLKQGEVQALGEAAEVVNRFTDYLRSDRRETETTSPKTAQPTGEICWTERTRLSDEKGQERHDFQNGETLQYEVWARFRGDFQGQPAVGVSIVRNDGTHLYTVSSSMDGVSLRKLDQELYYARICFPDLPLLSGRYHFNINLTDEENMQAYHVLTRADSFNVTDSGPELGLVRLRHQWTHLQE